MYNRYIPQPDGSHRPTRYPDAPQPISPVTHSQRENRKDESPLPCPEAPTEAPQKPAQHPGRPMGKQYRAVPPIRKNPPRKIKSPPQNTADAAGGGFLRQLLPKDLDTGDLLVIVLLLLMAGDCPEDKENALLTLALYLFL